MSQNRNLYQPQVEYLEERALMASSISLKSTGVLDIRGTYGNDTIQVRESGRTISVIVGGRAVKRYSASSVKSIKFRGLAGNDRFINQTRRLSIALGDAGNDTLQGGVGRDVLNGMAGNDRVYGNGGNDRLYGYTGSDVLYGQAGNDYMHGGADNDRLFGHAGNDTIIGYSGNDVMYGFAGHDRLYGYSGNDVLIGNSGNDLMFGHAGNDKLYGYAGVDRLYGGTGNDGLFGGGVVHVDYLYGQAGADRFLVNGSRDRVRDLTGEDARVQFVSGAAGTEQIGNDQLTYAAGTWKDAEILKTDIVLHNLHQVAGNTRFLKLASGAEVPFVRLGATSQSNILAWNSGTKMFFPDSTFKDVNTFISTTYHEIAHNWDETNENAVINNFRQLSKWTTQPQAEWQWQWTGWGWQQIAVMPYEAAGIKSNPQWHYHVDAGFNREYGKSSPREDFATTFETYFMRKFHSAGYQKLVNSGYFNNGVVQAKLNVVDQTIANLR